jgi:hypothetical protein
MDELEIGEANLQIAEGKRKFSEANFRRLQNTAPGSARSLKPTEIHTIKVSLCKPLKLPTAI